jgi:membrane fusion protein (multidrug efflux system)
MRIGKQVLIVAILAGALGVGWYMLTMQPPATVADRKTAKRGGATLVVVEAIDTAINRVVVNAIGTGEAMASAALHPTVSGKVTDILFRPEQRVKAGAPLLRLDDEHERIALRLAQIDEDEARRQVRRLEKLGQSGAVSTVQLETARAALETATLRRAQAELALRDRTVFAPFDGIIGFSGIDKGDRVSPDTLIATLDDRSSILVEFVIPEKYANQIRVGDRINVNAWTMADLDLRGTVHAVDSRIDPASRTLGIKARIPNPDDRIRPGTSFEVLLEFTGGQHPNIREVAVMWSRDGAYVWRVNHGRAEKVFVQVVRRDRGRILVDGPLQAGDVVVVEGVQGLREGQPLDPQPLDGRPRDRQSATGNSGTS